MSELQDIIRSGAQYLQQECSRRGFTTSVPAPDAFRAMQRVPLAVNVSLPGVDLRGVPRLLYMTPYAAPETPWLKTWASVVDAVADHDDLRVKGALMLAHPRVPYWRGVGGDYRPYIAQFLYAMTWYMGLVTVTPGYVNFEIPPVSLRLDQTGLESKVQGDLHERRLFPKRIRSTAIDYTEAINGFPYQTSKADRKVTALFLHLCEALPDLTQQICILFGAACQSNNQPTLLEPFDVFPEQSQERQSGPSSTGVVDAQDALRRIC